MRAESPPYTALTLAGGGAARALERSTSLRSSCGLSRSWLATNSCSISSQSLTRSSLSSRSLHLAFGVIAGSLEPRLDACAARRCLRPTRGGGGGGSHFFFFSCGPARARCGYRAHELVAGRLHTEQAGSSQPPVCTSRVVHTRARPSKAGAKQHAQRRQPAQEDARACTDGTGCCALEHMGKAATVRSVQLTHRNECSLSTACSAAAESAKHRMVRIPRETRSTPGPFSVRQARPGRGSPPGRTVPAPSRARCGTRRLLAGHRPRRVRLTRRPAIAPLRGSAQ